MIRDLFRRLTPASTKRARFDKEEAARREQIEAAKAAMRDRQDRLLRLTLELNDRRPDDVR
ncbi:hypothetical protein [Mameliella sediminis]|uniref:hypothetical protein n=1 Tax=Mameliella sediminis TaxID=2836866 RepID=UPI001C46A627|nr:hypothetical protein [Mameliella sediminis]MBV7394545.1 hypothetical protein [Mameliella sediminis]